jgi:3D (Asp-Asp-Asp) domain-containing protein
LLARGLDEGPIYYKMKVDKKASVMHHDPAVFNLYSRISVKPGRMDEVWNPDSTLPMPNTDVSLDKSNLKMQIIIFLLTIVSFICSVISAYIFNS